MRSPHKRIRLQFVVELDGDFEIAINVDRDGYITVADPAMQLGNGISHEVAHAFSEAMGSAAQVAQERRERAEEEAESPMWSDPRISSSGKEGAA